VSSNALTEASSWSSSAAAALAVAQEPGPAGALAGATGPRGARRQPRESRRVRVGDARGIVRDAKRERLEHRAPLPRRRGLLDHREVAFARAATLRRAREVWVHEGGRFEIHEDATTIRDDVVKSRAGRRPTRRVLVVRR
jgi:hypothetical protein